MTGHKGFTLIEILVVIVIVGITASFAVLAYGDFGSSRRVLLAAEQLAQTLQMLQQQAQMEGSTWGVQWSGERYSLVKFHPANGWASPKKGLMSRTYALPKQTWVIIKPTPSTQPAIKIYPSGDMTPCTVQLGQEKDKILATLTISPNGSISVSKLNEEPATTK